MSSKSILFWFSTFQLLFFSTFAIAADKLAIKNFEIATGFCERVLQADMPKSAGSLRIFKSNWKKYQNNMENALERDPSLAKAGHHTYTGGYFVDKTFAEVYQECNEELPQKVNEAVEYIDELRRTRQARFNQQRVLLDAIEKKTRIAMDYVATAINQHCATYVRSPSPTATNLQIAYQTAKQKALDIYPDIKKHFHDATMFNPNIGEEEMLNKTVEAWFEFCDSAFNITTGDSMNEQLLPPQPESVLPDNSNLMLPPLPTQFIPAQNMPIGNEMDEYSEENDPDFQQALKTLKGDRVKILKTEKRMPDFVDNEDFDLAAAMWWRYEKEDGQRCITYNFKQNLLTRTQDQPGECPIDY
jgi:hypothetical protein